MFGLVVSMVLCHWNGSSWTDHSLDIEEAIWGVESFQTTLSPLAGATLGKHRFSTLDRQDESWSNHPLPSELQGLSNFFKVGIVGSGENLGAEHYLGHRSCRPRRNSQRHTRSCSTGSAADLVTFIITRAEQPLWVAEEQAQSQPPVLMAYRSLVKQWLGWCLHALR